LADGDSTILGPSGLPSPEPIDIVETLIPRNLIHIIAAPVGIGKSTLIFQMCGAIDTGGSFLGYNTSPARVVYITADRSQAETRASMARLGMSALPIKIVSIKDTIGAKIPFLETLVRDNCKPGDLCFIEPLNFFHRDGENKTGNVNDFIQVAHFLMRIGKLAIQEKVTIVGSLHSSKAKVGEGYAVAREKILGSVAWAAFTSTVIIIEPNAPDQTEDPGRSIHLLPRNSAPKVLNYMADPANGMLVPMSATAIGKSAGLWTKMNEQLQTWPSNKQITSADILTWAEFVGLSRATAFRWLKQTVEDGKLECVEHGVYRKTIPN